MAFGSGPGRVAVVNRNGQPISLDKYLKRVVAFDSRSPEELQPLLDAIDEVIRALADVGTEAFLAWGTLLGAHREGRVIGNDSDADIAYVSRHTHPVDVIRESFRMQRQLVEHGYHITRYSALAFKVDVDEGDGVVRGLDVFGGFFMDGNLHLMGEIREPFEESWIHPLGTTTLEGRTFPAPADPDRVLAAMYGASWRVPDPAFHFNPPATTVRRLNGWFRGLRVGRAKWDRVYSRKQRPLAAEASPFVAWAAEREPQAASYVDLGCGRGSDVLWMAGRGVQSVGLDFQPRSYGDAAALRGTRRGVLAVQPARAARRPSGRGRAGPAAGTATGHGSAPGGHPRRSTPGRTCGGWPGWRSPERAAGGSTWSSSPASATTATPRTCTSSGAGRGCSWPSWSGLVRRSCTGRRSGCPTRRSPRRCAGWSWNGDMEMAEKQSGLVDRLRSTRAGEALDLRRRVRRLEAEVQECRALNVRLAELTDIVTELLLPVAARDEEKLAELLEKYRQSV